MSYILSICSFRGGRIVVSSSDGIVRLLDERGLKTSVTELIFPEGIAVSAICELVNGDLACGFSNGSIDILSESSDENFVLSSLTGHDGAVTSLCTVGDIYLGSGSVDCTIKVWRLKDGYCERVISETQNIRILCYLPRSRKVAGYAEGAIKIWNIDVSDSGSPFELRTTGVCSLCALEGGRYLASGFKDGSISIWNAEEGRCVNIRKVHDGPVNTLCYLGDRGRTGDVDAIFSGSDDKTIFKWNWQTGEEQRIRLNHDDAVRAFYFMNDGRLVSGSNVTDIHIDKSDSSYSITINLLDRKCDSKALKLVRNNEAHRFRQSALQVCQSFIPSDIYDNFVSKSAKRIQKILSRYQPYVQSVQPTSSSCNDLLFFAENILNPYLLQKRYPMFASQRLRSLLDQLINLCSFSSINEDIWLVAVEIGLQALISCSIAEVFQDQSMMMMVELWNRIYRNYKSCLDSMWESVLDGRTGISDSGLIERNSKFRDYLMEFFDFSIAKADAITSDYNRVENAALRAQAKASKAYSKLELQAIQNDLITPQQVEEAREAAKEALRAWQVAYNICQTTGEHFRDTKTPFLLERIRAWVSVLESYFIPRTIPSLHRPSTKDAEEFPYSILIEEKLSKDLDAKGETVVKYSRLYRTMSSLLVVVTVIRDAQGKTISRSRRVPTPFYIYSSKSDVELSNELRSILNDIEFVIKPDEAPLDYRLALDYKPVLISNFELLSAVMQELKWEFEVDSLRTVASPHRGNFP